MKYYVSATKCDGINSTIKIVFTADESVKSKVALQNQEKVHVIEGGRSTLSRINFPISFLKYPLLNFNITTRPNFGDICKYTNDFRTQSIQTFTLVNLHSGEIQYCHDDSESQMDDFTILIYSTNDLDFQYIATLQVEIKLKNDNEPRRFTNKTFHIVNNKTRIISKEILTYVDDDIDTLPNNIRYTNVVANNGITYLRDKEAHEFTQDNINNGLVRLQHISNNQDLANMTFIVTDGLNEAHGILEIVPGKPFITLKEAEDVIIKEYSNVVLNRDIVNLEINFDTHFAEIKYEVSFK